MPPSTNLVAALLVALQIVATVGRTASAELPKRDRAIEHYKQAEAYFKAKTFDAAAREYTRAYKLDPRPGLLFNIGLAHENHGDPGAAMTAYLRYLRASPKGDKAKEARARLAALELAQRTAAENRSTLSRHRARADELIERGAHLEAVSELRAMFSLDAEPTLLFEIGVAYANASEADLAYRAFGSYLESGDSTHAKEAAERRRAHEEGVVISRPTATEADGQNSSVAMPLVVSAVAATLLGGGVVFALKAQRLEDELRGELSDNPTALAKSDGRFDQGRTAVLTANVLFVGSAIATAAAGYLWWRALSQPRHAQSAASSYVVPTPSGVAIGGRF